jgi:benzylsuccinate CoA-transferase BbsF subunit
VIGRLGLGYEALRAVKQDIILLSFPRRDRAVRIRISPVMHLCSGHGGALGSMTGYRDGPPVEIRHVMDHTVGLNAAVAVVAALASAARHRRGRPGRWSRHAKSPRR